MNLHIDKPQGLFRDLVRAAFPTYMGRKFKLSTDIPNRLYTGWSGGSRDYYAFIDLRTMGQTAMPAGVLPDGPLQQFWDLPDGLPLGTALVERAYYMGRDHGITVFVRVPDAALLLAGRDALASFPGMSVPPEAWDDEMILVLQDWLQERGFIQSEGTTEDERTVLLYTRRYKGSYGRNRDIRFSYANRETGITRERWEAAKASCIERKLLTKAGAITPAGRNAIAGMELRY